MIIYPVEIEKNVHFMKLKPRRLPVPYSRTENNGYCSMLTNNGDSNYTMCNSTSMKILDMCNGEKTVEQILCTLVELYPEVEKSRAERDLIHTLSNFTRLDAIEWKDDDGMSNNPFVLTAVGHIDEQVMIALAGEDDIRDLSVFFQDFIKQGPHDNLTDTYSYFWGNDYREYMSPTMIRQCLYSYYKDFFVIKCQRKIIGVIAVKPAHEAYLNDAVIQLISVPKYLFNRCIKEVISYYRDFPYKKINALRVQVPNGNEDAKNVIEAALVPNGFSLEAIREKEYCGNQDIYVYCARIVRND
ncbi:PqqD family protein [Holdemanella sp.]|jgi:hypothetical protein|uniref:PqqD family protein n=1 Tax=Holdemanella sp. TaxID=1971762 RepID=UPI00307A5776